MGSELIQHHKLGANHIHRVTNWRFQDTNSRMDVDAHQFTAADIDKVCYDMETEEYYVLKAVHPSSGVPTWYTLGENLGAGEDNTISAVGGGTSLVKGKVGVDLQLKTLLQGDNVVFTVAADTVTIGVTPVVIPPEDEILLASAPVGGHRAVSRTGNTEVAHTDYTSYASCRAIVGISLGAASAGNPVTVRKEGLLIEPSWAWTPNQDIYLSFTGLLTQSIPASNHLLCVGTAITATSMQINLSQIIKLL